MATVVQLHPVGTAASIRQLTWRSRPTPHYNVILVGLCRFRIEELRQKTPFLVAKIKQLDYLTSMFVTCMVTGVVGYLSVEEPALPTDVQSQAAQFRSVADQFLHLLRLDDPSVKVWSIPLHLLSSLLSSPAPPTSIPWPLSPPLFLTHSHTLTLFPNLHHNSLFSV